MFIRELYVEYNTYVMLSLIFHIAILLITFVYVIKLQRVNQPVPDKPVSFVDSDDNGDTFNWSRKNVMATLQIYKIDSFTDHVPER